MEYFFDTEFIEDGKTIDLVSIGIVAADGRELYCVSSEFDASKADDWVKQNVLTKLGDEPPVERAVIRDKIKEFCKYGPEFWAYYADYDWVVLCQLFGKMINLPRHFPFYCRDLKQLLDDRGLSEVRQSEDTAHNALSDAKWVRDTYMRLYPNREFT